MRLRALCMCRGCQAFHLGSAPSEGRDAHHTRLLLALDLSLAAACRSRGIAACNGQDDDPYASGCDMGSLHSRAGEFALALASSIEDPALSGTAEFAFSALLTEIRNVLVDKPVLS